MMNDLARAMRRWKEKIALIEQLLKVLFLLVCSPSNPAPSRVEVQALIDSGVPFVEVGDIVDDCMSALSSFLIG